MKPVSKNAIISTSISQSKSKSKSKSKEKIAVINLNALPPPKPNYEKILSNLLKYLKRILTLNQYNNIKLFVQKELKNESRSDSLSSILTSKAPCDKKLKLSYDFSAMITSPKQKPVKIKISSVATNVPTKDAHSLYTIIKGNTKAMPSKTQSNSKSKSTSRDNHGVNNSNNYCYNHHNILSNITSKKTKQTTTTNKSQLVLNEKLFSKLNLNKPNGTTKTSKPIAKSLSKAKTITSNGRTKNSNHNNGKHCISSRSNYNSNLNSTRSDKINPSKGKSNSNNHFSSTNKVKQSVRSGYIDLNEKNKINHNNEKTKKRKNSNVKKNCNGKSNAPVKNEEMMKQIKNTLDDNLKVMFNFSYENFLSKESESESKKSSQQEIIITESYD